MSCGSRVACCSQDAVVACEALKPAGTAACTDLGVNCDGEESMLVVAPPETSKRFGILCEIEASQAVDKLVIPGPAPAGVVFQVASACTGYESFSDMDQGAEAGFAPAVVVKENSACSSFSPIGICETDGCGNSSASDACSNVDPCEQQEVSPITTMEVGPSCGGSETEGPVDVQTGPRTSARLAALRRNAVVRENQLQEEEPSSRRTISRGRLTSGVRGRGGSITGSIGNWLLPRLSCRGGGLSARWGSTSDAVPAPQLIPWAGWPATPDPLGEIPFSSAMIDDTSGEFIQCDGCAKWIQVHPEVVKIYDDPVNLGFVCRYLTGIACKGDFRDGKSLGASSTCLRPGSNSPLHGIKRQRNIVMAADERLQSPSASPGNGRRWRDPGTPIGGERPHARRGQSRTPRRHGSADDDGLDTIVRNPPGSPDDSSAALD